MYCSEKDAGPYRLQRFEGMANRNYSRYFDVVSFTLPIHLLNVSFTYTRDMVSIYFTTTPDIGSVIGVEAGMVGICLR